MAATQFSESLEGVIFNNLGLIRKQYHRDLNYIKEIRNENGQISSRNVAMHPNIRKHFKVVHKVIEEVKSQMYFYAKSLRITESLKSLDGYGVVCENSEISGKTLRGILKKSKSLISNCQGTATTPKKKVTFTFEAPTPENRQGAGPKNSTGMRMGLVQSAPAINNRGYAFGSSTPLRTLSSTCNSSSSLRNQSVKWKSFPSQNRPPLRTRFVNQPSRYLLTKCQNYRRDFTMPSSIRKTAKHSAAQNTMPPKMNRNTKSSKTLNNAEGDQNSVHKTTFSTLLNDYKDCAVQTTVLRTVTRSTQSLISFDKHNADCKDSETQTTTPLNINTLVWTATRLNRSRVEHESPQIITEKVTPFKSSSSIWSDSHFAKSKYSNLQRPSKNNGSLNSVEETLPRTLDKLQTLTKKFGTCRTLSPSHSGSSSSSILSDGHFAQSKNSDPQRPLPFSIKETFPRTLDSSRSSHVSLEELQKGVQSQLSTAKDLSKRERSIFVFSEKSRSDTDEVLSVDSQSTISCDEDLILTEPSPDTNEFFDEWPIKTPYFSSI